MDTITSSTNRGSRFFTPGPLTPALPPLNSDNNSATPDASGVDRSVDSENAQAEVLAEQNCLAEHSFGEDAGSQTKESSAETVETSDSASPPLEDSDGGFTFFRRSGYLAEDMKRNTKPAPKKTTPSYRRTCTNVFDAIRIYNHDEDFAPVADHEDFTPTMAPPGSDEKIEILAMRVQQGFPLWHDEDRVDYDGLRGAIRPRD